jgi:hypothetical protein
MVLRETSRSQNTCDYILVGEITHYAKVIHIHRYATPSIKCIPY